MSTKTDASRDRPPYVAFPRTLVNDPMFTNLARDSQWLLQHCERDPYRLRCGVLVYNPRGTSRDAKATEEEVDEWLAELSAVGWVVHDENTSEIFLTRHMEWDYTLSALTNAKGVLNDVTRVRSRQLADLVRDEVYRAFPQLAPSFGIDPSWTGRWS